MKVFVYFIGKPRDEHSNAMAAEFLKRTSRYANAEMREIDPARTDFWQRHAASRKILLDPAGRTMATAAFVEVIRKLEDEGRDVAFVIGGHAGFDAGWKSRADLLLSLSAMTFPHELARAMLCEQVYRAFATLRGHPYPR